MTERIFGTDGVRGRPGRYPLDPETVGRIGALFAEHAGAGRILIVRDPRESGEELSAAFADGIARAGGTALLGGVLPTPAASHLLREDGLAGGAAISASHNPYTDNGIKLLGPDGRKLPEELERVLEQALEEGVSPEREGGAVEKEPGARERYLDWLARDAPDLEGLRVVLDCANGAASELAPEAFANLGALVEAIHVAPDGRNINEGCGSTHPEGLAERVVAAGADLGIAFDGDADRAVLVDSTGRVRDGDDVLFLCTERLKESDALSSPVIVGTPMTNAGLERALGERGIRLHRAAVGDRHVLDAMLREDAALGGEPSGHVIFLDRAVAGDGLWTGITVCGAVVSTGAPLSELCDGWSRYPQVLQNVDAPRRPPLEEMPAVAEALRAAEEELGGAGRVSLRYSGTEPLARVMVEGPTQEIAARLAERISDVLRVALAGGAKSQGRQAR